MLTRSLKVLNIRFPISFLLKQLHGNGAAINYKVITPGKVQKTDISSIPTNIEKPDYSVITLHKFKGYQILDDENEVKKLSEACKLAKHVLELAQTHVEPGVTTQFLDEVVHKEIISLGAYPSPLDYRGFPASCCTSVNNVVCHGIPDDNRLEDGDIINVDVSVYYNGYHGDTSNTFPVGAIDPAAHKLIDVTRRSLHDAIKSCQHGEFLSVIGEVIEDQAVESGFSVSRRFVGHGIGKYFHTFPNVCHYRNTSNERMLTGMVFTIEPILMEGSNRSYTLDDGWTEVSHDKGRSAQAEHTLIVTREGCQVLT